MLIKDILEKFDDAEKKKLEYYNDLDLILKGLGLDDLWCLSHRKETMIASWLFSSWLCTDTRVGHRIYFRDDGNALVPFAYTFQPYRKYDETVYFIGDQANVDETRSFILDQYSKYLKTDNDHQEKENLTFEDDIPLTDADGNDIEWGHNHRPYLY